DQPDITEVPIEKAEWILCIATHGAGEYADSIFPFMQALTDQKTNLSTIQYALIGIGDSSYDTFNQAGQDAQNLLTRLGARARYEPLTIDMLTEVDPEGVAINWLDQWKDQRAL
ncbi:flavodoxin domain-containing protein, partial [Halomonas sp. BM-2019]|uniref:flavodoxin domain-containing protein n=1 Tax=Halomonas sp. BM-2019 TaxID=2811227 RepID=UPI001B3C2BB6